MNKQLKDLTDIEIKALVYDANVEISKNQAMIQFLEKELSNRVKVLSPKEELSKVEATPEVEQNTNKGGTNETNNN